MLFATWNLEIISINLKSIVLVCSLNAYVPRNNFVKCTGYLENVGSLSYADLLNVHTFYYMILKHSVISPLISSKN